jgi:hypothetical protein
MEGCSNLTELVAKWVREETRNCVWNCEMTQFKINVRLFSFFYDIQTQLRNLAPCYCVLVKNDLHCVECPLYLHLGKNRRLYMRIRHRAKKSVRANVSVWPEFVLNFSQLPGLVTQLALCGVRGGSRVPTAEDRQREEIRVPPRDS